jgi:plastocyanin domain-containing protein
MFQQTTSTVSSNPEIAIQEKKASLAGPIAGGVVASVAVIVIVVSFLWFRRRKHQKQATDAPEGVREIDASQIHEMGKSNVINEVDGKPVPRANTPEKPVPLVEMA